MKLFFPSGHLQPTHIVYPAEPSAMTYRPMPASQLQPLSHFSQSGHFQYIAATNPSYQNTSFTHTSATFQPQRIAYGLQPGSIQVATPVHTAYIARPPRPMEQRSPPVGYGLLHTSIPPYNSQLQTPKSMY